MLLLFILFLFTFLRIFFYFRLLRKKNLIKSNSCRSNLLCRIVHIFFYFSRSLARFHYSWLRIVVGICFVIIFSTFTSSHKKRMRTHSQRCREYYFVFFIWIFFCFQQKLKKKQNLENYKKKVSHFIVACRFWFYYVCIMYNVLYSICLHLMPRSAHIRHIFHHFYRNRSAFGKCCAAYQPECTSISSTNEENEKKNHQRNNII